jgi:hypothetical protein
LKKNPVKPALIQRGDPATCRAVSLRAPVRIFCFFLALILWLAVVNLNKLSDSAEDSTESSVEETHDEASAL